MVEHERRFIPDRDDTSAFLAAVSGRLVLDEHHRSSPVAYTRTTYMDTDDLTMLRSCRGAIARRVRLREYASAQGLEHDASLTGACFLELKESAGAVRTKQRFSAAPQLVWSMVNDGADLVAPFGGGAGRLGPGALTPRLTTWYRRWSFHASDETESVRVSLDESIAYCRPVRSGGAGAVAMPEQIVACGPSRVIEVKHIGAAPTWLTTAIECLHEAPRFSKFRDGMEALMRAGDDDGEPVRLTEPMPVPDYLGV
jgi:hypothetical protein